MTVEMNSLIQNPKKKRALLLQYKNVLFCLLWNAI